MRILYLLLIAAANLLTAKIAPLVMAGGTLIVPIGSLFAGAVFVLRDLVQLKHGRRKTYTTILVAAALSAVLSAILGDTVHVALASVAAFFASEAIDTEIFSRLRRSLAARIMLSGILGGIIDSALFVLIGLSPLGAKMLPWGQVPSAMLGQVVVKAVVQFSAAAGIIIYRNKKQKEKE